MLYRTWGLCCLSVTHFWTEHPFWLRSTNLGSNIFSMLMNLQLFTDMHRDCIWANVRCFIAGVCGCCGLLVVNNKCPTVIQASVCCLSQQLWINFVADGGLFEVWRHKTELLMRKSLLGTNSPCCMFCLFLCENSMRRRAEPTVNYGSPRGTAAEYGNALHCIHWLNKRKSDTLSRNYEKRSRNYEIIILQ